MELLKEIKPDVRRAAILFNPETTPNRASPFVQEFEATAHSLSIEPISAFARAFQAFGEPTYLKAAEHAMRFVLGHLSDPSRGTLYRRFRDGEARYDGNLEDYAMVVQALLDLYTIRERRGKIDGLHVLIIGDILFSRVARSNIFGLLKLGARVTLVGPSTLVPREFEKLGVEVSHKIDNVLPKADVVNLLRIQHERQRKEYFPGIGEYILLFGLTKERAKLLKSDCLIMHPGPINRGVEIDSEVADGLQSVILDQVTNGLAVRMAALYLCGGIST